MHTYRHRQNYRKIYEQYHGSIPYESNGRTYEIHHIDGNHNNNNINNLIAITIQEHYNLHYAQGDYGACHFIKLRMKLNRTESSKIQSDLSRKIARKRVADGTHPWLGDKNPGRKRVADGTHLWLGPEHNRKMVEAGIHPFLGGHIQKKTQQALVKQNRHHLQGGSVQRKVIDEGRHPSQVRVSCLCCKQEKNLSTFTRDHGDKCKLMIPTLAETIPHP